MTATATRSPEETALLWLVVKVLNNKPDTQTELARQALTGDRLAAKVFADKAEEDGDCIAEYFRLLADGVEPISFVAMEYEHGGYPYDPYPTKNQYPFTVSTIAELFAACKILLDKCPKNISYTICSDVASKHVLGVYGDLAHDNYNHDNDVIIKVCGRVWEQIKRVRVRQGQS